MLSCTKPFRIYYTKMVIKLLIFKFVYLLNLWLANTQLRKVYIILTYFLRSENQNVLKKVTVLKVYFTAGEKNYIFGFLVLKFALILDRHFLKCYVSYIITIYR